MSATWRANGRGACWRWRAIGGAAFVLSLWPTAALYAQVTLDQTVRACRQETATRLKVTDDDVVVQPGDIPEEQAGGPPLNWFTTSGAQGQCRFQNGRLASWTTTRKGRSFDPEAACVSAVAKMERVRPQDVDIIDLEKRSQRTSTLLWTTYQGVTGKCVARQNRIESIERD